MNFDRESNLRGNDLLKGVDIRGQVKTGKNIFRAVADSSIKRTVVDPDTLSPIFSRTAGIVELEAVDPVLKK